MPWAFPNAGRSCILFRIDVMGSFLMAYSECDTGLSKGGMFGFEVLGSEKCP